jgi:hypothetical protein
MIGCEQTKLQPLSRFIALGCLPSFQEILHEVTLVCGKTLTASKKIEKGVPMLNKDWPEFFGSLGDC